MLKQGHLSGNSGHRTWLADASPRELHVRWRLVEAEASIRRWDVDLRRRSAHHRRRILEAAGRVIELRRRSGVKAGTRVLRHNGNLLLITGSHQSLLWRQAVHHPCARLLRLLLWSQDGRHDRGWRSGRPARGRSGQVEDRRRLHATIETKLLSFKLQTQGIVKRILTSWADVTCRWAVR